MSIRLLGGVIIQKDGCKTVDSRCEARLDACTCMSLGDLYMYLVCLVVCRVVVLASLFVFFSSLTSYKFLIFYSLSEM